MTPTTEQTEILSHANTKPNISISAYAGCGKTSTLELLEHAVDTRPVLYLVFNKKNAEEAEKKLLSTTTVRTFNSLGHRIWAKACAKNLSLNSKKTQDILRSMIDEVKDRGTKNSMWDSYWEVVHGVGLAKSLGYIPEGTYQHVKRICPQSVFHAALDETPDDLTADLIDAVLTRSIKSAYEGAIDFNDQVYMPALFGGAYPRFPVVFVDEAQDLSPVNHAMLDKLGRNRIIAVGDPNQSIYQFRGAVVNGFDSIRTRFSATPLTLSTSFRCPSEIVKHVHWRVPEFKWLKEGGSVDAPKTLEGKTIEETATIICRNNAPLIGCALRLLGAGRSVSVAGSDIGPKLIALLKKMGPATFNRASLISAINDWEAERLAKESSSASDMAACMRVFAEHGENLSQALAYTEHIFAQKGSIRLMTGHKAKGLEFDIVYHLDPHLVRRIDRGEQDMNLDYVISTRSKDRLIEIDSTGIRW